MTSWLASRCPAGMAQTIRVESSRSPCVLGWFIDRMAKPTSQRCSDTMFTTVRDECGSIVIWICGWSAMNAAIARGRNDSASAGAAAICSEPRCMSRISSAVCAMRSMPTSERCTSSNSACASAVGWSRPRMRSNRENPTASSRSAISRVVAGCEMWSISAARVTVWQSITARKASSWRIFMPQVYNSMLWMAQKKEFFTAGASS
ncbi:protein of unknown function [Cupriavidus taiwanensis]|nr:protein of unknown function [Cupriavidus taiwanensis]